MKFGHDLLLLEAGAPESLRGQFIQYKQLKKLLKQLPAAEDRTEAEQEFFRRLRAEVQAVNRCASSCQAQRLSIAAVQYANVQHAGPATVYCLSISTLDDGLFANPAQTSAGHAWKSRC